MRRLVFPASGAAQVALCGAAIATAAYLLGQPLAGAAVIGAALCLSSTAMVMPILAERKRQHSTAGPGDFLGAAVSRTWRWRRS